MTKNFTRCCSILALQAPIPIPQRGSTMDHLTLLNHGPPDPLEPWTTWQSWPSEQKYAHDWKHCLRTWLAKIIVNALSWAVLFMIVYSWEVWTILTNPWCFKIDDTTLLSMIINDKHLALLARSYSVKHHLKWGRSVINNNNSTMQFGLLFMRK